MSRQIAPAPIRRTVLVAASPERSFATFVERMHVWWNPAGHLLKLPVTAMVVEPFEGGRWYEKGDDGVVADWGQVLVWDPPKRLVLSWGPPPGFSKGGGDDFSELEVNFVPEGETTRINLEQRYLERFGEAGHALRAALESSGGWPRALKLIAADAVAH